MGVMAPTAGGIATAGGDREHAASALNAELADKGFLLTSTDDLWSGVLRR
jgi:NADH-quinone oxidoreductase subunit B